MLLSAVNSEMEEIKKKKNATKAVQNSNPMSVSSKKHCSHLQLILKEQKYCTEYKNKL